MTARGPITTHVLDQSRGRPAAGVAVLLEIRAGESWRELGRGTTDDDGRVQHLLGSNTILEAGEYRISFAVAPYFAELGVESFYSSIAITFLVVSTNQHYHVPLLLSPFGYSTYRGS